MSIPRPYEDTGEIRVFQEDLDSYELIWHYDQEDRRVEVVESDGWLYQEDNHIPVVMSPGDIIIIPKGVWHRIIKGKGRLVVKINA